MRERSAIRLGGGGGGDVYEGEVSHQGGGGGVYRGEQ